MTFRKALFAATLALASAAGVTAAQAKVMTAVITLTSPLTSSFQNFFGDAPFDGPLAYPLPYTLLTITYDTSIGTRLQSSSPVEFDLLGGIPPSSPLIDFRLQEVIPGPENDLINMAFPQDDSFLLSVLRNGPFGVMGLEIRNGDDGPRGTFNDDFTLDLCSTDIALSLDTPFSADLPNTGDCPSTGFLSIDEANVTQDALTPPGYALTRFGTLDLTPQHITVTAAGAPEPAGWALMVAGFGGLGAALRRRRRAAA